MTGATCPRNERGATMVEMAMVLPVFLVIVIGLFTSARFVDRRMQFSHAARDGARYGASLDVEPGWAAAVKARVVAQAAGDVSGADVCVALVVGSGASPTVVAPGAPVDPSARVVVRISSNDTIDWVVGHSTHTWHSTSTALWEPSGRYESSGGIAVGALGGDTLSDPSSAAPDDTTCTVGDDDAYADIPSSDTTAPTTSTSTTTTSTTTTTTTTTSTSTTTTTSTTVPTP